MPSVASGKSVDAFDYVIRFRGNIKVTDAAGLTRPVAEWVGKGGRARKLRDARVTAKGQQVGAVVCVQAKGMKEPWCLATSLREAMAATLVNHYAKGWTIEPQFRDTKNLQFGMGLSATRIGEPMRRDRLLLISALATALLTLLGMVGESLGMDRILKPNTSTKRTPCFSAKGACSTNSSPTCQNTGFCRSCRSSTKPYQPPARSAQHLLSRNEGIDEPPSYSSGSVVNSNG